MPGLVVSLVLLSFLAATDLLSQAHRSGYLEDLSEDAGPDAVEELSDLAAHPVFLASAGVLDLLRIPWIDAGLAVRIVEEKRKRGGYRRLEELLEVPGMTAELYELIRPYVRMGGEGRGSVRLDTKRSEGKGDARLFLAFSNASLDLGLKTLRDLGGEESRLSGYVSLRAPLPAGLEVTAGDMYVRLGEGLLAWPSFGALRSPRRPIVYPLGDSGPRPTTSALGEKVVRGAGLSFARRGLAAHLVAGSTGDEGNRIPAGSLDVAVSLRGQAVLETSLLFHGESGLFGALSFRITHDGIEYFTECAGRGAGGGAFLAGLTRETGEARFLFLYRLLSHRWGSPFGFDMALGDTEEGNIQAVYTGIELGKGKRAALAFYGDVGTRIYKGQAYTPAGFEEFSLFLSVRMESRVALELSGKYARETAAGKAETEDVWRLRWDTRFEPTPHHSLLARWQLSGEGGSDPPWRASLFSLEAGIESLFGFAVKGRFTSVHCGSGGSVSVVEGGLTGRIDFVRLSGEEERYSLVIARGLGGGFTLRGKAAWSLEREVTEVRGFELAGWRTRPGFQLQCERKF